MQHLISFLAIDLTQTQSSSIAPRSAQTVTSLHNQILQVSPSTEKEKEQTQNKITEKEEEKEDEEEEHPRAPSIAGDTLANDAALANRLAIEDAREEEENRLHEEELKKQREKNLFFWHHTLYSNTKHKRACLFVNELSPVTKNSGLVTIHSLWANNIRIQECQSADLSHTSVTCQKRSRTS